jgi:hypothetical protein
MKLPEAPTNFKWRVYLCGDETEPSVRVELWDGIGERVAISAQREVPDTDAEIVANAAIWLARSILSRQECAAEASKTLGVKVHVG